MVDYEKLKIKFSNFGKKKWCRNHVEVEGVDEKEVTKRLNHAITTRGKQRDVFKWLLSHQTLPHITRMRQPRVFSVVMLWPILSSFPNGHFNANFFLKNQVEKMSVGSMIRSGGRTGCKLSSPVFFSNSAQLQGKTGLSCWLF